MIFSPVPGNCFAGETVARCMAGDRAWYVSAMSAAATTLFQWLNQAPFALGMSSGFFGFYAHAGVLMALEERDLQPTFAGGSSAGALVTGLWAAGVSGTEIARTLTELDRATFWDPALGLGLLRGRLFREKLRDLLPVHRFEDARIPLSISVFDIRRRRTDVLRSGDLPSALHASCAFPGLFQPVKREGALLSDGGIADRPGLSGFPHGVRVFYHHLSSKSPWRRSQSPALSIPAREQMVTLQIADLPRANPFRLERGRDAMRYAYEATQRVLDRPLTGDIVAV